MAKLKVPSLQHLARNWRGDPKQVARLLVDLVSNPPTFNYDCLFGALRELLVLRTPYLQVVEGLTLRVKRADVLKNVLEVLPLMRDHFAEMHLEFVQAVAPRYYPLGRGLMIPFAPPLIYVTEGIIRFPWFSFWRSNPLSDEALSLFVSVVDDLIEQDPDLDEADFHILDFSALGQKSPRILRIIDGRSIERLSTERKVEMLAIFVEGYRLAEVALAGMPIVPKRKSGHDDAQDSDQFGLFPDHR